MRQKTILEKEHDGRVKLLIRDERFLPGKSKSSPAGIGIGVMPEIKMHSANNAMRVKLTAVSGKQLMSLRLL